MLPEEINRIICDHCADLLLAPDQVAHDNLLREGLPKDKIHIVGSTALEAATRNIIFARKNSEINNEMNLEKDTFVLVTVHRSENTNDFAVLEGFIEALETLAEKIPIVIPLHPRTRRILKEHNIQTSRKLRVIDPQGYLDFLCLLDSCLFVITDSGGIQEEAAALDTPCLILRNETEWTYLTDAKKNLLIGTDSDGIVRAVTNLLNDREELDRMKRVRIDFNTGISEKIVEVLRNKFER